MRNKIGIAAAGVCLAATALAQPFGRGPSGQFPITQSAVSTFELTAPTSAILPVTVGVAFAEGAIPSSGSTDAANSQFVVFNRHQDGSVKTAQITVRDTFTSDVPLTVTVYDTPASGGTDLTPADIDAAAPTASITFASCTTNTAVNCTWTASLADLDLTAPDEIWVQGPEMIEAIYRQESGKFHVEWHVRLYADDRVRVRALVSYGSMGVDTHAVGDRPSATYTPTVTIGGSTIWNNGGAAYTHHTFAAWDQVAWIGGDPAVDYAPDIDQLYASRVVSTYWKDPPSESALNALAVTYTPGANLSWPAVMGDAGEDDSISILPLWSAMCLTSGGDPRACDADMENARAITSYPINLVKADGTVMKPSEFPLYGPNGNVPGGENGLANSGSLLWETAHNPQAAMTAYVMTGDPLFYKALLNQAASCYLVVGRINGGGVDRVIKGQNRLRAWCLRNIADAVNVAKPTDAVAAEYLQLRETNVSAMRDETEVIGQNDLGFFYKYGGLVTPDGRKRTQTFMDFFWILVIGRIDQMNVLDDETDLHAVMDHFFPVILGLGGPGGAGNFCYNAASVYELVVADTNTTDTTQWYDSWGEVSQRTCEFNPTACNSPYTDCTNTLLGNSGGAPTVSDTGFWGQYRAALGALLEYPTMRSAAMVVLNRIKGATNAGLVINPTAGDNPQWGVGERTPGVWRD